MATRVSYLFSDSHQFPTGGHPFVKLLAKPLRNLGRGVVRAQVGEIISNSKEVEWKGLVSEEVIERFPPSFRSSLRTVSSAKGAFLEKTDYSVFHAFVDELSKRSRNVDQELMGNSGLVYNGLTTFEITETRWLDPIFNSYATVVDAVADELSKVGEVSGDFICLTGKSFVEKVASSVALKHGMRARFIKHPLRPVLDFLQNWDARSRLKLPFKQMEQHWKKYTVETEIETGFQKTHRPLIVYHAYKERTLRRVQALTSEFKKHKDQYDFLVLGNLRGFDKTVDQLMLEIKQAGFNTAYLSDFLKTSDVYKICDDVRKDLKNGVSEFFREPLKFEYQGFDLSFVLTPFLKQVVQTGSTVSAVYAEASNRFLKKFNPELLILSEEWESNRALSLLNRRLKKPSLYFQFLSPAGYCGLIRRVPNFFASSGSFLEKAYVSSGNWPKEKVRIVGDPVVDVLAKIDRRACKEKLAELFSLDVRKPFFLLLLTYPDALVGADELEHVYRQCIEASQKLGAELILKNHPQYDLAQARQIFINLGIEKPLLLNSGDLIEIAAACDLAFMTATSAAMQVMLAKTPLVSLYPKAVQKNMEDLYHFRSKAGIPVLDLKEDLSAICKNLLQNKNALERQILQSLSYVEEHVGPLDGNSAIRFKKYVAEIISKSSSH